MSPRTQRRLRSLVTTAILVMALLCVIFPYFWTLSGLREEPGGHQPPARFLVPADSCQLGGRGEGRDPQAGAQ